MRLLRVQSDALGMSAQIIDTETLTYRQITESPRCVVVDSPLNERNQGAVGSADSQRSEAGAGQLHRCIDDSMQHHIQVQIRTDLTDDPHQLFHLVASCHHLVKLVIHSTHQLPTTPPGERRFTPVLLHTYKAKR